MTYCSLEEAWGSDYKEENYFAKVNAPPSSSVQNRIPTQIAQKGLEMGDNKVPTQELDKFFPSYSGGAPSVTHTQSAKSKIVPYQVSFPDTAKRNYLFPVESNIKEDDDDDSALDLLEDNSNDIRFIDKQRRVKPDYEPDYLTSEDYFLYKKYMNLAQKYKEKLRRKYKNFIDEDENNKKILEGFAGTRMNAPPVSYTNYSMKDMIIIIIVGIFLIFALDIFVKMGARMK